MNDYVRILKLEQETMERKLASVKRITELRPIPGADLIECAIIGGGWPVVVKRNLYGTVEMQCLT